ncbi:MAG: YhcH/YjgK/YiaL family protein [Candidatus Roseilinea sp.]|uniref:YhcH/YjgK/YiaL family protein n=1 Tax=Candidatus Roseilinea sp. TaxID=2838777 RepID=UPI00404A9C35
MIVDQLSNVAFYFNMSDRLAAALRFLQETDPFTLAPGPHDVQGADVYALVQHYESRPLEKGKNKKIVMKVRT